MIWLYALTNDSTRPLPTLIGQDGKQLEQTRVDGIAAVWSSWMQEAAIPSDTDSLWHQQAVLEALMEDRTLLPLRYGTVLEDAAALTAVLMARHDEWLTALGRVEGCVEMAVRATVRRCTEVCGGPGESGTGYLTRRKREFEQARELAGRIHRRLAAISTAGEACPGAAADGTFTGSYLVPRGGVDHFGQTVGRLAEEAPDVALVCTGPWPPYSFANTACAA